MLRVGTVSVPAPEHCTTLRSLLGRTTRCAEIVCTGIRAGQAWILGHILHTNNEKRFSIPSFTRRLLIAIDIMTALQFLHIGNKNVQACYHRDIKSANIVLTEDYTAQLIDCGLAKLIREDEQRHSTMGAVGTFGYICPDYVGSGDISSACDIFSFGVVMAELWTGKLQNHTPDGCKKKSNYYKIYANSGSRNMDDDLDSLLKEDFNREPIQVAGDKFKSLARQCMSESMEKRPSGKELLGRLEEMHQIIQQSSVGPSSAAADPSDAETNDKCKQCRSSPALDVFHGMCHNCHFHNDNRRLLKLILSKIDGIDLKLDRMDLRLFHSLPSLFLILPAERKDKGFIKNAKSWLRASLQDKYHLFFFVCTFASCCIVAHSTLSG